MENIMSKNQNKQEIQTKSYLTWILFLLGLTTIVYSQITGNSLFPTYKIDNLKSLPIWQLPFSYLFSYITRAWGPLIFAFTVGGIIIGFVPKEKFQKLMASNKFKSYLIAASGAPLLTVCSCAMIPIFGGLLVSGAGIGPAITFLLMAPAANIMAILFTGSMISWKIAAFRIIVAYIGSIIVGIIVSKTPHGKKIENEFAAINTDIDNSEENENGSFIRKSYLSYHEGIRLAKSVLPYLLGGVAVISFVEAYLPPQLVAHYLTGAKGTLIAAFIGVPTYTPSLVEVFLVNAMLNLGMAPAAALAFLIGAPICSIPSMMAAAQVVRWKVTLTYALLTILVAMIGGLFYLQFITTL